MMILSLLIFSLVPAKAETNFLIACGQGKVKNHKDAYVALKEEDDAMMEFYLEGKALASDDFDIASDEGAWIVTLPPKGDNPSRKFLFLESKKSVQEYVIRGDKEKKVGSALSCLWKD